MCVSALFKNFINERNKFPPSLYKISEHKILKNFFIKGLIQRTEKADIIKTKPKREKCHRCIGTTNTLNIFCNSFNLPHDSFLVSLVE